jgi:hypothetical protein
MRATASECVCVCEGGGGDNIQELRMTREVVSARIATVQASKVQLLHISYFTSRLAHGSCVFFCWIITTAGRLVNFERNQMWLTSIIRVHTRWIKKTQFQEGRDGSTARLARL